jgi:hypothetical protein
VATISRNRARQYLIGEPLGVFLQKRGEDMPGKTLRISLCVVFLAATARSGLAARQKYEDARLGISVEVQDALSRLVEVSKIAWTFDNLRPTLSRAVWPGGTAFAPPQAPVVHLSPASPVYGELLGEMAFWDAVYGARSVRLHETAPTERARLEKELDYAGAEYRRASARAWAYNNLRTLVRGGGSESATIINPFLPAPAVYLSPSSPTAIEIIGAMRSSEARIKALKEALEKPGGNALQLMPPPDLAMLVPAWQAAAMKLTQLAGAAQDIQRQVDAIDRGRGAFATPLYGDLAGARVRVIRAQWEVATIAGQIEAIRQQAAQPPAGPGGVAGNAAGNAPAPPNPPGQEKRDETGSRELRKWTYQSGRSVGEARFVRLLQNYVFLRTASGRTIKVRLDRLSDDDRAWIHETTTKPR